MKHLDTALMGRRGAALSVLCGYQLANIYGHDWWCSTILAGVALLVVGLLVVHDWLALVETEALTGKEKSRG